MIISFTLSYAIYLSETLKIYENKVYDSLTKYFNPNKKSDSICIIYIDQQSIEALSKQGITWPWPRQIYAPVIEFLSEADAVFVDLIFSESSSYGVEDDQIFANSIKKAGNVYLPFAISKEKREFDLEYLEKISITTHSAFDNQYKSIIFPIDELKKAAKGLGNVTILPDEDGIYRRMPLFFKVKEYSVPNLIMSYILNRNLITAEKNSIILDKKPLPLFGENLLIKYSSDTNSFKTFTFIEILNASIEKKDNSLIKNDFFRGKIVLIGLSAAGLFDLKPTPISSKTPGVFIHATILENLINKDFLKIIPKGYIIILLLTISFFIPFIFVKQHSMKTNLLTFIGFLFSLILVEIVLFKLSFYMVFLPSLTCLIFTSLLSLVYSYAKECKEKSFIKRTFLQYMDKKIVEYILSHPEIVKPGGQQKTVTVFFADIAGFTSISEKLSPENTAMMLHKVLNSLTEVIIQNHGVIDKYIGACVMSFWGAPIRTDEDEFYACLAALQCFESIKEINKNFLSQGLPEIKIRIGIHTGDAVVGNIGSNRLFNYTVIGDTVNIASRLESVNKFFRTNIIISENTYSKVIEKFILRQLGIIIVKGKTEPIGIYELLAKKENADDKLIDFVNKYNNAYSLFYQKRFREAKKIFQSITEDFPDDMPSNFYLKKIKEILEAEQLTDNWLIVRIEEK
jgi:adenylate cyclase